MLQFETLLLRELQKQQNRDEFCDTVLQTEGLSVPVHSCVLSAFSPWLCGRGSSMPVLMAGQRWVIDLHDVDAQTLLSLVSLIYSGHLSGNQEQVLSTAQSLGIEFPQLHQKARPADNKRQRQETGCVKEVRECGAQTEDETQTNDRETQTENECVSTQNVQAIPVYLIDQSTHFANQEPSCYSNSQDATLAIPKIHGHPDNISGTYDILAMAPEIRKCNTVSESAFQINMLSSDYQACIPVLFNSPPTCSTSVDLGVLPANTELQQVKNNIAAFSNNFLHYPLQRKKEQGCLRGSKGEVQGLKKPRTRSRGGGTVSYVGGRGSNRQMQMKRCGWVAGLAWRGQGGGRVGRKIDTRSTVKQKVKVFLRRRGRGALVKAGETRACSSEGKGDLNRPRRSRGRPRLHPHPSVSHSLYYQNLVQSPYPTLLHTVPTLPASQVKPTPAVDSFLDDIVAGLNSLPLNPTENSTNSNDQCVSNFSSIQSHSNSVDHVGVKPPEGELGEILEHFLRTFEQHVDGCNLDMQMETPQKQSENLITKVNGINLDKGSEESHLGTVSCTRSFKTWTQLEPSQSSNPQQILPTDVLPTYNTPTSSNQNQYWSSIVPEETQPSPLKQQVPLYPCHDLEHEKPSGDQIIRREFRMMTRSQSLKRKLDTDLDISKVSSKRGCRKRLGKNTLDLIEKNSPRLTRLSCSSKRTPCTPQACKSKEGGSMGKATQRPLKKERQKEMYSTRNSLSKRRRSRKEVRPEAKPRKSSRRLGKGTICDEHQKESSYRRNCSRKDESLKNDAQMGCKAVPQTGQLTIQDTIEKTYSVIASSALKIMEILLQMQNEKETRQKSDQKQIRKHVKTIATNPVPELGLQKQNWPVQLDQHLSSAREEEISRPSLSTADSSKSTIDSLHSEPVSPQSALSHHSEVLNMTDLHLLTCAYPQPTPEQVSDPLPGLLTLHRVQMLQASESSEEDEVDVLAVSSPISELASSSTVISEAGFSTDEDVEIDVVELD